MKRLLLAIFGFLLPGSALAQRTFTVSTFGLGFATIGDLIDGMISVAEISIVPVCIAIFVTGALFYILGGAREELKTRGRDMMIGSLIGVGVVFGARAILNMVLFFLYG